MKATMDKKIENLQFITHNSAQYSFEEQIQFAIEHQIKWIQLRAKNISKKEFLAIAKKAAKACQKHGVKLIINDHVDIALTVDADGVHLGKKDMSPTEARSILGEQKIIGGTANSMQDIANLYNQGVDYVGLGPFKFTTTKEKLSPTLGLIGYEKIIKKLKKGKVKLPIIAIGGIEEEDISLLKKTGIDGIAVSSLILKAKDKKKIIEAIFEKLEIQENAKVEKMDVLKYPIGHFKKPESFEKDAVEQYIKDIEKFPKRLKKQVKNLSKKQLDTAYRPDGWTLRQVVHHCADSHMNNFIRLKLALTEDNPIVKPYFEDKWAALEDSKTMSFKPSLKILKGLHIRWAFILKNLSKTELKRIFTHPEHNATFSLEENIGFYAWHCNHHLAHIIQLKKEKGWK